ncbi:hypothetical protein BEH94_01060 [Candidatus Altiarchaeales archaeon WOR_SM1_SCG]|nr:hypothetical protein BEH94_01060 [Candidatus Altiarchaeales archaeon WOR_SM1_SCG]
MSEIEELRKRRMQELMQQQAQQEMQQQAQVQEVDSQLKFIMAQILTPDAQERISNIHLANPDFARQVEVMLVQLYQAGKLPKKVNDAQLKEILMKLQSQKRETRITRR